jgi:2-keto-4-pentenoate hydratase/2-oxohepta-3-ene-1,7-dioic acid hydratase in catechol pathway
MARGIIRVLLMRLVTYDRGGARRLGAWVDGTVVDLPDAVGHPSFPTTMERLVEHAGGTILDAAREALSQPDVGEFVVQAAPRLLVPLLPRAFRQSEPAAAPRVLGPEDEVPWPPSGSLGVELELACVLGRTGRDLDATEAEVAIFGYTIVNDWSVARRPARGNGSNGRGDPNGGTAAKGGKPAYVAFSLGPCIVTADEFDPSDAAVEVRVDGRARSRRKLSASPSRFAEMVAESSRTQQVQPGDLYGSGARARLALSPGVTVEVEAEGIGILRSLVSHRPRGFARRR